LGAFVRPQPVPIKLLKQGFIFGRKPDAFARKRRPHAWTATADFVKFSIGKTVVSAHVFSWSFSQSLSEMIIFIENTPSLC
jgi:hypothetical protein